MEWPKITKGTSLKAIKAIHQRIWDYVIKHGGKPCTPYHCHCVACAYDDVIGKGICTKCPIAWPGGIGCFGPGSLYTQWGWERDPEKKRELAKQIRDIPFKYELES